MENELIPLKVGFDVALRGFDRNQVKQYLHEVQEELRVLSTDRNSALSQVDRLTERLGEARAEVDALHRKVDELAKAPVSATDLGERLNKMIELANADAKKITDRAEAAAQHTRASAEHDATQLRGRYQEMLAELDKTREDLLAEHAETMRAGHAEIERLNNEATEHRNRLDSESTGRRDAAEADFADELRTKKAKLAKEVSDRDAASRREADKRVKDAIGEAERRVREATGESERRVREATAEAKRMIDTATDQVNELRGLRSKISEQLGSALELLHKAGPTLTPDGDEEQTLKENGAPLGMPPRPVNSPVTSENGQANGAVPAQGAADRTRPNQQPVRPHGGQASGAQKKQPSSQETTKRIPKPSAAAGSGNRG